MDFEPAVDYMTAFCIDLMPHGTKKKSLVFDILKAQKVIDFGVSNQNPMMMELIKRCQSLV